MKSACIKHPKAAFARVGISHHCLECISDDIAEKFLRYKKSQEAEEFKAFSKAEIEHINRTGRGRT